MSDAGNHVPPNTAERCIDVLLSTYNGARTLPLMLEALTALDPPDRPWRLVVVDNASTDSTPGVLDEWSGRLPMVRLHCPTPGKAAALRMGLDHLRGDLVVFTDDDVLPVPGWLRAYERAADSMTDCDVFGGPIRPHPIDEPSPWFAAAGRYASELYALTDTAEGPVVAHQHLYGPNFMMRREAAVDSVGAPTSLGPDRAGGAVVVPMGEDTLYMLRTEARGLKAWFVREAAVRHCVRRFQTELGFILSRARRHGRGAAILQAGRAANLTTRLRLLLQSGSRAAALRARVGGVLPAAPDAAALDLLWNYNWHLGAIAGALYGPF